jgi:hypothetical protein
MALSPKPANSQVSRSDLGFAVAESSGSRAPVRTSATGKLTITSSVRPSTRTHTLLDCIRTCCRRTRPTVYIAAPIADAVVVPRIGEENLERIGGA